MPHNGPYGALRHEWRALGVDFDGCSEVISGPESERDELDLNNDADPKYDAIVVQHRTVIEMPWRDETAAPTPFPWAPTDVQVP